MIGALALRAAAASYSRRPVIRSVGPVRQPTDQRLAQQAKALVDGEHDRIANAANLSSLVDQSLPDLN
jgi:putative methionine-R-sulfoxide reductase with GAF domain